QRLRQHDRLECGQLVLTVQVLEEQLSSGHESRSAGVQVETAIQNTWEQALHVITGDGIHRPSDPERLLALLRIGRDYSGNTTLEALLQSILQEAVTVLRAQRGCLALVDETTGHLTSRALVPAGHE